jgi:membrane protein
MRNLRTELAALLRPRTLHQLARHIARDDIAGLAAEVAFYLLFALFPFLLFVGSALGLLVSDPDATLDRLLVLLHRLMPAGTATLLGQFLAGPVRANRPYLLSLGVLGILWAGSQGFAAVLKALNRVYCASESRSWVRLRALSLDVMVRVTLASVAALVLMTGFDTGGMLSGRIALSPIVAAVWRALRWPALFIMMTGVIDWLYRRVPCVGNRRHGLTPGALVGSLVWILVSVAFALYMDSARPYTQIYGAVGDVVVLMSWIYLGSFAVLLGAEINTRLEPPLRVRKAPQKSRAGDATHLRTHASPHHIETR